MIGDLMRRKLLLAVFICGAVALPCHATQAKKKKAQPKPDPIVQPTPPPPPLTPQQMPAQPPEVVFNFGQLTITAPNSTLSDILRAVHKQTGASVDVPPNATERVIGKFGPGPARDVLASLLNGSHFNYVLLGSATNPLSLDRVMLTQKSGADTVAQAAGAPPNPGQPQTEGFVDMSSEEPTESEQPQTDIFANADDQNNQNQGQPDDQQQNGFGQGNPFAQPGQANVKTPEQMLQELQQRQQQIQQQQQQQGIPAGLQLRGLPPGMQPPQPQPQPQ